MGDRNKHAAPDGAVKSFGVGCFYKHFATTWLRRVGVTYQFFNWTPTSNFKTDFQFCLRLTTCVISSS